MPAVRFLVLAALVAAVGCGSKGYDGPTVKEFNGKVVQGDKAVSFAGQQTRLELFLNSQKPESFLIPIQDDGSFKIGWMPIGKYSATLIRKSASGKGGPSRHPIAGGLTIEDGKTEYVIDLGSGFKP